LTLHIYQTFNHICYNLILTTRVIPILSFYGIQNQIGSHIIFYIKGQVQTSHLSNFLAYRQKSHFRDKGQSITFILPNTKPKRFTYHVCKKVHLGTSSNFPFIKLHDKGQFNTLIFPNLKPNRFKYHVLNHGTSSTFIFIKIVTILAKISFSQQGSFQYFHFTKFKTK